MNIFVLSTNPVIAASYHCDQHLHKMILESAQMLSTAAHLHFPRISSHVYKPAYPNHPCTKWVCGSLANMAWLCSLAIELNTIRETQGCNRHASMDIIDAICDYNDVGLAGDIGYQLTPFAEAMPAYISLRPGLTTVQKYQEYYRKKHRTWIEQKGPGKGMTYVGREVPDFMKDLIS